MSIVYRAWKKNPRISVPNSASCLKWFVKRCEPGTNSVGPISSVTVTEGTKTFNKWGDVCWAVECGESACQICASDFGEARTNPAKARPSVASCDLPAVAGAPVEGGPASVTSTWDAIVSILSRSSDGNSSKLHGTSYLPGDLKHTSRNPARLPIPKVMFFIFNIFITSSVFREAGEVNFFNSSASKRSFNITKPCLEILSAAKSWWFASVACTIHGSRVRRALCVAKVWYLEIRQFTAPRCLAKRRGQIADGIDMVGLCKKKDGNLDVLKICCSFVSIKIMWFQKLHFFFCDRSLTCCFFVCDKMQKKYNRSTNVWLGKIFLKLTGSPGSPIFGPNGLAAPW